MTGLPPYFKKDDLNSQFHGVKNIFSTTLNDVLLKAGYDSKYFMGDVSFAGTNQLLDALRISTISNENNTNFKSPNDSDLFLELKNSLSNRDKNKKFAYFVSTLNTHFPNGIFDENVSSLHKKNILDFNELDINLLDKNELDEDELVFTRLDFNLLDVELLANILDLMNAKLLYETETFPTNPISPGTYEEGRTLISLDGEWLIRREVNGRIFSITLDQDDNTKLIFNQAGSALTLHTTENASDTVITINQN